VLEPFECGVDETIQSVSGICTLAFKPLAIHTLIIDLVDSKGDRHHTQQTKIVNIIDYSVHHRTNFVYTIRLLPVMPSPSHFCR
jgi:hypothetical protein